MIESADEGAGRVFRILGDHLSGNDRLAGDLLVVLIPSLLSLATGFITAAFMPRRIEGIASHRALVSTMVGAIVGAALFLVFCLGQSEVWAQRWHDAFVD